MFGPYFSQKLTNQEKDWTVQCDCDFEMKVGEFYSDVHQPGRAYILKFQS